MNAPASNNERIVLWILAAAGLLTVAHAFIPLEEFVHRTDDAFYYFKTAYNYPAAGYWTFDGIHSTNGVQPLWAVMLTALAQAMAWVGVRDPDLFARCVVGLTAIFHVASCLLLFRLLARQVSLGVAATAAAALLLPMGIVWQRAWGMENSLYAFCLAATASYYQGSFRGQETTRRAIVLGLLFGVAALARLNAVLFAVCAVAVWLIDGGRLTLRERIKYTAIVAAASASCVIPYLAWNYATTGHPLPISGAVKSVLTEKFLEANHLESQRSPEYVKLVLTKYFSPIRWFFVARVADCSAILGGRLWFRDELRTTAKYVLGLLALASALPFVVGSPREYLTELKSAFARLRPLTFVFVYAVVNFVVSLVAYPHQLGNAIVKWWLVSSEIVIVVLGAVVVGTALAHLGTRIVRPELRTPILTAGLVTLVALHAVQMARFYGDGKFQLQDWNTSWNDESYNAAQWLAQNAPEDAVVGSWNAGVLGYYARQRVTNLDGLINNFELLPYLQEKNVGAYIAKNNISYLSDMESTFTHHGIHEQLKLQEVYRRPNELMNQDYVIYKVER